MRCSSAVSVCLVSLLLSGNAAADLALRGHACQTPFSADRERLSSPDLASDARPLVFPAAVISIISDHSLAVASDSSGTRLGLPLLPFTEPTSIRECGPGLLRPGGASLGLELEHEVAAEMPLPPGSASLALTGLLGVAGIQVLRSARHWSFGSVPEWYQAAYNSQIGSAVPLDFSLDVAPAHLGGLLDSGSANELAGGAQRHDSLSAEPVLASQHLVPTVSPRGPPLC